MRKDGKVWILCLGYNAPHLIEGALASLKEKNDLSEINHEIILVDPSYPIPSVAENALSIIQIGLRHPCTLIRPYANRGVTGNWNWAMKEIGVQNGDIIIGLDPDERPQQEGWVRAIMDVFQADPSCYYLGLNQPGYCDHFRNVHSEAVIGGRNVCVYRQLINWSFGGFSVEWINKMGGLTQKHPLYGYIEQTTYEKGNALGGRFLILKDFINSHIGSTDPQYEKWKQSCANGSTNLQLNQWLQT